MSPYAVYLIGHVSMFDRRHLSLSEYETQLHQLLLRRWGDCGAEVWATVKPNTRRSYIRGVQRWVVYAVTRHADVIRP